MILIDSALVPAPQVAGSPIKPPHWPQTIDVASDDGSLAVRIRPHNRARRFILRVDRRGTPVLTVPEKARPAAAVEFLSNQVSWLTARLAEQPRPVAFADGSQFPLRDIVHRIEHRGAGRGTVWIEPGDAIPILCVAGRPEHLPRRVADWLRNTAKIDLSHAVDRHCRALGVRPSALRVCDPRSRWGSCSSTRRLSFSWRLILAPIQVLDYVAAHECAHLIALNHSAAFWRLVDDLHPDVGAAKSWLSDNSAQLHAYG
jgi:predicted metal-dependent hydrolase